MHQDDLFLTARSLAEERVAINILPHDGIVDYYGRIFNSEECEYYFSTLMQNVEWRNDEAVMFGRHIITRRKVAWYGDTSYAYTYSKKTRNSMPWTPDLLALRRLIEQKLLIDFNSCLLNLYHDGDDGMAWHSDDEKGLGKNSIIASLTFGAERNFLFRHKRTQEKITITLENGSLIVMRGNTQENWLHSLPKTKKITTPRINLTFRRFNSE